MLLATRPRPESSRLSLALSGTRCAAGRRPLFCPGQHCGRCGRRAHIAAARGVSEVQRHLLKGLKGLADVSPGCGGRHGRRGQDCRLQALHQDGADAEGVMALPLAQIRGAKRGTAQGDLALPRCAGTAPPAL